jgi:hypothetical protein
MKNLNDDWFFGGGKKQVPTNPIYIDAYIFSFRRIFTEWTLPALAVERQSDGVNMKVFFNDLGLIGLDSLITIMASNTPSTTTLGDFIGSGDACCSGWYAQNKDNIIIKTVSNSGHNSDAPYLIKNGIIVTEPLNGLNAIDFSHNIANNLRDSSNGFNILNPGNAYTIISVSTNDNAGSVGTILTTSKNTSNRMTFLNDRSTDKRVCYVYNGVLSSADTITQQNISSVKLLTVVNKGDTLTSYYNGELQENEKPISGSYENNVLYFGAGAFSIQGLYGRIQEVILYPSDKTDNLNEIHSEIKNNYLID